MSIRDYFNKSSGGGKPGGDKNIDVEHGRAVALVRRGLLRRFLVLAVLLLAFWAYQECVVVTNPDEAVVVRQFGEIRSVTTQPGVSFKWPFIQSTQVLPSNMRIYDIPISDVITQDKKTMVVDSFVLWRINDPTSFVRTLPGGISDAEPRISNNTYSTMKNVISLLPQTEIISGRDMLALLIFENMGGELDQYGLELLGIETKHLDLPDDNKQAVYLRMISERNNIAASYQAEGEEEARLIRNDTDKNVNILLSDAEARAAATIADGEQQYMQILAEAYNDPAKADFYAFVRALDAARVAFNNGQTTLLLPSDSPIAQIFNDYSQKAE